ncbi:hypothetical protein [Micromonospora sp. NPDC047730]|uniref:hypothetical protein n=1 Tax=Micromonospora sp. NPDC047730 TaxID=3364253 RepID=UPI003723FD52
MTAAPAPVRDTVANANNTVASHWRPEGEPWQRTCQSCTDDGCPAYDDAMRQLMALRKQLLRIGTATYGVR